MKYSKIIAFGMVLSLSIALTPIAARASSPRPASCPATPLTHNLTLGSRDVTTGGDVTALQTFLGALLNTAPTGYFGTLTRAAVAKWQAANSVLPAVGYVGSLTHAAIERYCTGTPVTVTAACPDVALTHDLSLGATDSATGGDVSSLQTFLGISPTGYFDSATKQSAVSWQASNSISPAVGYVGPLTRAAIIKRCNPSGESTVDVSFSATPSVGTAPLAVAFSSSGAGLGTGQYIIDYGDSATSGSLQSYCTTATSEMVTASCEFSAGHTYASPGVYSASLEPYIACMWSNPRCELETKILGSATITVGKVATTSSLKIPGSVTLAPGASASAKGTYSTNTLTVNSVSISGLSANFTWTESHCGTSGCLGAADPAAQTFTLRLSGAASYTTALGHAIVLTAVGANSATVDVSK
ncbi:MAG: peptidoglycan-binding protein [bacterium]|nr:peptidoglycan-binding protein [bacterium]